MIRELTLIQAKKYADLDLLEDSEDEQRPISTQKVEEEINIDIGSLCKKKNKKKNFLNSNLGGVFFFCK